MKLHILQKSIICLLPLIFVSFYLKKYIYCMILLCNLLISLYVHRINRTIDFKIEDYIDKFFILIWICKNIIELIKFIFLKNIYFKIPKLFIIILHVCNCYNYNLLRNKYDFRTYYFNLFHMFMHFSGILGTLCLIIN